MRKSQCYPSKYFRASDPELEKPVVLTISRVAMETMAEGGEKKPVAYFLETDKGLVITPTKFDALELITGMPDYEDWPGTKVMLDTGLTRFKGKPVKGIFVHPAPRKLSETEQRAEIAEALDGDELPMHWGEEEPDAEQRAKIAAKLEGEMRKF